MRLTRFSIGIIALFVLAGCGGSRTFLPAQSTQRPVAAQDTAAAPGGGASGLPGGGASGLPGGGASGLPGGGASGLPGAILACGFPTSTGSASCPLAINSNVSPNANAATPAAMLPGLHPSDLASAYALPVSNAGGLVAIVDAYDDPSAESDLAVYRSTMGLPDCTSANGCFRKLNQSGAAGAYPAPNAAWSQEIALDLEMVSAVCPKCTIALIEANSNSMDDLGASVDAAAAIRPAAISNSYYATEWSGETAEDAHYTHPGIAITVSAGDQPQPAYPAASAHVTSVGGTSLQISNGSYSETAWSSGARGCSAYEPRPNWQHAAASLCQMRSIVDVAAVADPQTGVAMYSTQAGGWVVGGGTSIGAPLVAAAYALSSNPQGPAYSYLHYGAFGDVAPSGYDLATGLGSPRGTAGL